MSTKEKLIEEIRAVPIAGKTYEEYVEALADKLLDKGIISLPCIVYSKKNEKYQIVTQSKQRHLFASKLYINRKKAEKVLERSNQ